VTEQDGLDYAQFIDVRNYAISDCYLYLLTN
jgi:hypothetical protein